MATPTQEEIDTFVRITGASRSLALRKLEEYGGNLAEAVNAHFRDLEQPMVNRSAESPQYHVVDRSNHMPAGPPGILHLISTARTFTPSMLLDSNYRRNLWNQIGASVFPSRGPQVLHTGDFNNSYEQPPHHSGLRPPIDNVTGNSFSHAPQYHENVSRNHESHLYGDNTEEEMIQMAIEASKREGSSGTRLPHVHILPEDEEFALAVSLSLEAAEQEQAIRELTVEEGKRQLEVNTSSERDQKFRVGRLKSNQGSSSSHEGVQHVKEQPLWSNISSEELDQALLLEKTFFGENPESTVRNMGLNPEHKPHSPSPSVVARWIRKQQDDEYLASLMADIEKEVNTSKEAEISCLKEGESQNKVLEVEEIEQLLEVKRASLCQEPAVDDENAVTLLVRLPDGSRIGRRFLKSDKLQCLFDFIDVGEAVKPGKYKVVRQYPKQAFCVDDCSLSLNELGLTNKQEALFLELI